MFRFSALFLYFVAVRSCEFFEINIPEFGEFRFLPLSTNVTESAGIKSGRTAFATAESPAIFLYHVVSEPTLDGVGRWVINDQFGSASSAMAYIDSWAVLPHLIPDVNDEDKTLWQVPIDGVWTGINSVSVNCFPEDRTVYLEGTPRSLSTTGFYLEAVVDKEVTSYEGPLYTQVKAFEDDLQLYLYKVGTKWIVGDVIGNDGGFAFVEDENATWAHEIRNEQWNFVVDSDWQSDFAVVISGSDVGSVYYHLRDFRSMKFIPTGQRISRLRNDVVMPVVGFGTGAIPAEQSKSAIDAALRGGYRLLDLAREYANEHIVAEIFGEYASSNDESLPRRSDVFLISKVWPTHLGVIPTTEEVFRSLESLQTTYVDLYYIHWPG